MNTCGKPVKFIGKITSGKSVTCVKEAGHSGNCEIFKTILAPNASWLTHSSQPQGGGTDLPQYFPKGVVIQ